MDGREVEVRIASARDAFAAASVLFLLAAGHSGLLSFLDWYHQKPTKLGYGLTFILALAMAVVFFLSCLVALLLVFRLLRPSWTSTRSRQLVVIGVPVLLLVASLTEIAYRSHDLLAMVLPSAGYEGSLLPLFMFTGLTLSYLVIALVVVGVMKLGGLAC